MYDNRLPSILPITCSEGDAKFEGSANMRGIQLYGFWNTEKGESANVQMG